MLFRYRFHSACAHYFYRLALLQKNFFYAYLKKDYLKNQRVYAKDLFVERCRVVDCLQRIRKLTVTPNDILFMKKTEHLHDLILAKHLLRFRIDDYAVFEVCQREMQMLRQALISLFIQFQKGFSKKKIIISFEPLLNAIEAFENSFDQTLSIVVRDPMVFILFIKNNYALKNLLEEMVDVS